MLKNLITSLLLLLIFPSLEGKNPPNDPNSQNQIRNEERASLREPCQPGISRASQDINNVRAMLLINGDCWWDGDNPQYIVPKPAVGELGVSAIFAGAVWIGGFDDGGSLKLAAKTYGAMDGRTDFWPGPINLESDLEDDVLCSRWDKHFEVLGTDIDAHRRNYQEAINNEVDYEIQDIPTAILGWPATGNVYFESVHGFELPVDPTDAGLAGFFDRDGDDAYEPEDGDYPVIEIRGCPDEQYADQMFFWIYNDDANVHSQSQDSDPMSMEVQVQSFAYKSNDELNNMTFQRYKLINRGTEPLDSTFFAMWVDPDLGCGLDDYIGCDVERDLAYVYNSDLVDGDTPGSCDCGGTPTYCTEIPLLGIDYFRGPRDEIGNEIGMSSFVYYNNSGGTPTPQAGTTDPRLAQEFYNYLSGSWLDGAPFTEGGSGRGGTIPTKFVFPGRPTVDTEWTMTQGEGLPNGDRRTLQASGPFRLTPGAVNELIIGAVFVPDVVAHPRVDLTTLLFADDIAQAAFDNCFNIPDGPDAPDVDWLELDQELVGFLSNDPITSNNYQESYEEKDLRAPDDSITYVFEGYELYQLRSPISEIDDVDNVRRVFSSDLKNEVTDLFEYTGIANTPGFEPPFLFEKNIKASGIDEGIRKSFKLTVDAFTNEPLINNKKYYFRAIAYGYNNYLDFNATTGVGQRFQYIRGRRNSITYTVIPRKVVTDKLNSEYGDGPIVTRLDGEGAGETFLEISDESREEIFNGTNDGRVIYEPNSSPVDVQVINPFKIVDGEYELRITDGDDDGQLDSWTVTDQDGNVTNSERSISELNEQLLGLYGFSVSIAQTDDVGENIDDSNGTIGFELEYLDPDGPQWLTAVIDQPTGPFDYVKTESGRPGSNEDPNRALSNFSDGGLVPFRLTDADNGLGGIGFVVSPFWDASSPFQRGLLETLPLLTELNNIDIVFTSDKDKWSRCVILEAANEEYYNSTVGLGLETEGDASSLDLRGAPSVGKEAGSDGKPLPDGDTDSSNNPRIGMGWFPGYAIDVETGERLNIFFAENSVYDCSVEGIDELCDRGAFAIPPTGRDMMFNPTSEEIVAGGDNEFDIRNTYAGGQHFIYVTNQPYDRCEAIYDTLIFGTDITQFIALNKITWTGIPLLTRGSEMLSYADGLIPNDVIVKARVDNPYAVKEGMGTNEGDPTYLLNFEGVTSEEFTGEQELDSILSLVNVVPNPYYGFSDYEADKFSNIIKITNLPAKATVTIYTLAGRFVRRYDRDETGVIPTGSERLVDRSQILPALEWDLKNFDNIPVSSGIYLIHIDAPGAGQTVLKWFGIARQFDPTGL